MLLICPVRPGDINEELRYALRSWEQNLILPGGLELWTVGYKPSWLKPDHHIDGNHHDSMPLAVFDNIYISARAAAVSRYTECLFMNDDFFCMDPVGAVLPVRRNETLAQQITKFPGGGGLWWPTSLRLTASWLASQGHSTPDSYEIHRPLVADPAGMEWSLNQWLDNPDPDADTVPQWRTVYGVLQEIEAYPVGDAKLSPRQTGIGTPWVSTSDMSWRRYGIPVKQRFQKPSRWEAGLGSDLDGPSKAMS